ncbi:MAG: response regulator [Bacteroidetes bacterium]|nr:response regulator [Bacteroidota bacterium]
MKNLHLIVVVINLLLSVNNGKTQSSSNPFQRIYLNNFDGTDFYSAPNFVIDIVQDDQGFLWLGTNEGLIKYDGTNEQVFSFMPGQPNHIGLSVVSTICLDRQGYLWLGYHADNKIVKFNPVDGSMKEYSSETLGVEYDFGGVNKIYEDREGFLWFGTRINSLYRFDPNTEELTPYLYEKGKVDGISSNDIRDFAEDSQSNLWIATIAGLSKLDKETGEFTSYKNNPDDPNSLNDNYVSTLEMDKDDVLWMGTIKGGLNRLDTKNGQFQPFEIRSEDTRNPGSEHVTDLWIDDDQILWVGTLGGGVFQFDKQTHKIQYIKLSRESDTYPYIGNGVQCLMRDETGSLWAGTYKGLHQMKSYANPFYSFLDPAEVAQVKVWNDKVWTGGKQLYLFDRKQKTYKEAETLYPELSKFNVGSFRCFYEDSFGHWWIVVQGRPGSPTILGQFIPETSETKIWFSTRSEEEAYRLGVTCILQDDEQHYWLGTFSGLMRFNPSTGNMEWYKHETDNPNSLAHNVILKLLKDKDGHLWVGTQRAGLDKFDPKTKTFTHYNDPEKIFSKKIYALHEDANGHIWAGTSYGLFKINKNTEAVKAYLKGDGLPSNRICSIQPDPSGNIWVSTDLGVSRLNPKNETFRNYSREDGMVSNDFIWGCGDVDEDGNLYFGGTGVTVFHPDSLSGNKYIPPIQLTGLSVLNKQILPNDESGLLFNNTNYTNEIHLQHHQNVVNFEYAALNYIHSHKNQYAYKMEGFRDDWQYVGGQNVATYTNLSPGKYTFRVKGANNDGFWNEEGTALSVIVHPPWYWSWWSKTIYALLAAGLIYILYRFQLNRQLAEREAIRLREMDKVKTRLYTNITHEFRTPLTVIQGMAEQINGKYKKETRLIRRNSKNLLQLVNQMLDLSKLESGKLSLRPQQADIVAFLRREVESYISLATSNNIELEIATNAGEILMDFDAEKIRQILANLLSNAIKFMPKEGGEISVEAGEKEGGGKPYLELQIKDNGIGIPEAELEYIFDRFYQVDDTTTRIGGGTGIGLALTKEFVQLMKGQISVESEMNQGTTFKISLPITRKASFAEVEDNWQFEDQLLTNAHKEQKVSYIPLLENPGNPLALIIEDNEDVIAYLISCLQDDFRILTALNGKEGIKTAIEKMPDIIISDVMMPEADGYEVTQALKKDERTSHIPIILLTAKADQASKLEGLGSGADAFLSKPFDKGELMIRIEKMVALRRKLQSHYASSDYLFAISHASTSKEDSFLIRLKKAIEAQLDNPEYDIVTLAKDMHLSRSQLYRKTKALTGQSIASYVRLIRLHHGRQILKTSEKSVSQVAFSVGFSDPGYFSKCYSEVFGYAPSEETRGT